MKTSVSSVLFAVSATFYFWSSLSSQAQISTETNRNIVRIEASDPSATEPGPLNIKDPGAFTITRSGPTNHALSVFYHVRGSASNGVDFVELPASAMFPVGSRQVQISVLPKADALIEGDEFVEIQLMPSPLNCVGPQCDYGIGIPSNAVVVIHDAPPGTNQPPTVVLVAPTNGAVFASPVNIPICADARDADGYINFVEFFAGTNRIGSRTNCLPCAAIQNPFCILWSNAPPGEWILTAKATDNSGATKVSEPVRIFIKASTNHPPFVQLNSPQDGAVFDAPATIFLRAYAADPEDGSDVKVEFFQGTNNLGFGKFVPTLCPSPYCPFFALTWSNVPPGVYELTARATDSEGAVGKSSAVRIRVVGEHTNQLPIVKITKPFDGQTFPLGANVPIRSQVVDPDGYVNHVVFFADGEKIGEEQRDYFVPPPPGQPAVFEMVWTNPPSGRHVLTATASDDQGATAGSPPVAIWIVQSNLQPTIVTISARDAIASEGTNCCHWVNWVDSPTALTCGANTATFVIRRTGPTNNALAVHYRIEGTASNGVDYVALPNYAIVPAGQRAVEIKLVPIDDNIRERLETVVLGLRGPPEIANVVPPYFIGSPSRAAAVIVDNDAPRPSNAMLADRCFHLMKPVANGTWWRIESSTNMVDWVTLDTTEATDGALHFVDPGADESASRFYRAVPCEAPDD